MLLMTELSPSSSMCLMDVAASTLLLFSFVGELQKRDENTKLQKCKGLDKDSSSERLADQ